MDLYKTLGVTKDASQAEIKKAYRALAKKLHPDLHPGDKAAERKFKEVSSANEILKDPEKRARYDRCEIDATGAARTQQYSYREHADGAGPHSYQTTAGFEDFADVSDLFADLFAHQKGSGGQQHFRMRGHDVRYELDIGFLDAASGTKKRISMPDGSTLDVTIPPGTNNGQSLRLKGKGLPGIGDAPHGDALVKVGVQSHPIFKRDGNDIVIDLPVTIDEAILGGKVSVPTIQGRVNVTIPPGTSSGEKMRLKGKGIKRTGQEQVGDQIVLVAIKLPEKVDDELVAAIAKWKTDHAYNPRRQLEEEPTV